MQQILEGRQIYTEIWTDRLNGRDRLEDIRIYEMILLKWICNK